MSWSKSTTLWCDGDECYNHTQPIPNTLTVVEDMMCENVNRSKDGEEGEWYKAGAGEHYCPNCKEEVKN